MEIIIFTIAISIAIFIKLKKNKSVSGLESIKIRHENIYRIFLWIVGLEVFSVLVGIVVSLFSSELAGGNWIVLMLLLPFILIGFVFLYFKKWYSLVLIIVPYMLGVLVSQPGTFTIFILEDILNFGSRLLGGTVIWDKTSVIIFFILFTLVLVDFVGMIIKNKKGRGEYEIKK